MKAASRAGVRTTAKQKTGKHGAVNAGATKVFWWIIICFYYVFCHSKQDQKLVKDQKKPRVKRYIETQVVI